jgi:hypothetical protein
VVGEGVGTAGVDAHHRDAAVMSVGRDREVKDGAVVRLRDEPGAVLALRLRPGQVRTLANGLGGTLEAVE